jgi:outer membrane receptor for ferrienterochelin and colicins
VDVKNLGYTYQWRNIDDAVVRGIEMTLLLNPMRNLNIGTDFSINSGSYKNTREDWRGTSYEGISDKISRFPSTSGSVKIEYASHNWSLTIYGFYQGKSYIDYISEMESNSKIRESDPYMTFNASISRTFGKARLYVGGKNIFSYVQVERHLDDAAFLYAPVYGALYYTGLSLLIN